MWSATSLRNFPNSSRFPVNGFGSFNLTVLSVLNFEVVSFKDSPPFPLSVVAICFFIVSNSRSAGSDSSGAVSKLAVSVVGSKVSRSIVLGSNSVGSQEASGKEGVSFVFRARKAQWSVSSFWRRRVSDGLAL